MIIKNMFENKITAGIVGLTVSVLLLITACGSPVTGSNRMNFFNRNSANRPPAAPTATPNKIGEAIELPGDLSKIPTLTYCEMIKNAADYDQKIVRVRSVYFNGFERMFFYDEHCVRNEPPTAAQNIPAETWIEWDADFARKDASAEAKHYHAVKSGERKDVTVVGMFYATRAINNTGDGKHQFRVMRVEKLSNLGD